VTGNIKYIAYQVLCVIFTLRKQKKLCQVKNKLIYSLECPTAQGPREPLKSGKAKKSGQDKQVSKYPLTS
jgi:hypothetical protein